MTPTSCPGIANDHDETEERDRYVLGHAIKVDSDNFVAEVVDGAPPISPLPVGRRAIELCLAATESAEKGQRVAV